MKPTENNNSNIKKKVLNARTAGTTSKETTPPVTIFHAWCKRCGICINFCPKKVLAFHEDGYVYPKHPEKCIKCMMCDLRCPDFAITVNFDDKQ